MNSTAPHAPRVHLRRAKAGHLETYTPAPVPPGTKRPSDVAFVKAPGKGVSAAVPPPRGDRRA